MNVRIAISRIEAATKALENVKKDFLTLEKSKDHCFDLNEMDKRISEKQVAILKLLAEGYSIAEIANELDAKPRTIEGILVRLRINYQYRNTTQMVAEMVKKGIV